MSFNFPLILVLSTAFTGLIWILEVFYLKPRRLRVNKNQVSNKEKISSDNAPAEGELKSQPLLVEYSVSFFPVLAIVLIFRSFLFEPFQIPSGSMIPTLKVGDFILVNKYHYGLRLPVIGTKIFDIAEPKNGEVMVFIPPHRDDYFIKRIVGIPGDKVRYQDKVIYINGKKQTQTFVGQIPAKNPESLEYKEKLGEIDHLIHRNPYRQTRIDEWMVPEGYYFMLGDNRDQSSDSRYWGLVSEENIVGKAVAVWMHKEPGFNFPEFTQNRLIQ
ncbi:MAG: signal peptidase I [Gammaproteobacteria bacterium]|nr:signal peptidase I [Gammaproteobacteria bacterium]